MLVEPRIQAAEIERSRRERPGSVATYDIYLRALAGISSESAADNAEAYALLLDGLAHDPDNPRLLAHAAWAIEHRNTMGWPPFGPDDRQRCADFARRGARARRRRRDDPGALRHVAAAGGRANTTGGWRCCRRRWRPTPTIRWCWCAPPSPTCTAATSTRRWRWCNAPTG